jgi:hypothetical protein
MSSPTWTTRRPITQQILADDKFDWLSEGGPLRLRAIPSSRIRFAIWLPWVVAAVCLAVAVGRNW